MPEGARDTAPGDWLALLRLAARTLGWTPHDFWRATPVELRAALEEAPAHPPAARPMTRAQMTDLARRLFDGRPRTQEKHPNHE